MKSVREGFLHSRRLRVILLCSAVCIFTAVFAAFPHFRAYVVQANRANLEAVAGRFPRFTAEQRIGVLREMQSQRHPKLRDMSLVDWVKKIKAFLGASATGLPPAANFAGNLTAVSVPAADLMELAQQSDCSLTLRDAPYSLFSGPVFSYTLANSTPNYGTVLHNAAGLTTSAGNFPSGCGNTNTGVTSRKIVFPGITTNGVRVYALHFYNGATGQEGIFTVTAKADDTFQAFTPLSNANVVVDLATSDLNGDGNGDLVAINNPVSSGGNATATVFLGNADGSFHPPTEIPLAGNLATSAVIDDFNGDGKKDLVVSTATGIGGSGTTYYINFLAGKGDGTFEAPQSYTETPPAVSTIGFYFGLISADLRGSSRKDLVTSAGIVLFGNGDGTFTQSSIAAFPVLVATSEWGPNVVAADFNKDSKLDLAVDNGETIQIYIGKGDGTFTFNSAYSTIDNVGYLVAQDLDGDGNVDLYSGTGNNGSLGGDQFDFNMGYALMGNGDGTFRGAPSLSFAYTGTNLSDLNGDKFVDGVGVNANLSFTSYLGDGAGNFGVGSTLSASPVSIAGTQYTLSGIDSYYVADVNGDGNGDLVYLGTNFYGPNYVPGIFIATAKGDGTFNAPTFVPAPPFIPAPDFDVNPTISGIRVVDMNHDGKLDLVYIYNTASFNNHTSYLGIAVQFGNGDDTFKTTSQLTQLYSGANAPNPGAYQVALISDLNKDNNPDLFVLTGLSGNSQSFTLQTYLGKGDGTFNAPAVVTGVTPPGTIYGTGYAPIVVADMNNDGALDIVALADDATTQDLDIVIALGNGDGSFQAPKITKYASQYLNGTGIAVADFDGDGKQDVATVGFLGPYESGIAFGNGDGTLQTGGTSPVISPAQSFYVGMGGAAVAFDINGDGKPDILSGVSELLNGGATGGGGGTPDFGISLAQADVSIAYGTAGTGSDAITISSLNGFSQAVTLSCAGAPAHSTCSMSPASVTPSGASAGIATVTITTDVGNAATVMPLIWTHPRSTMTLASLLTGALFVFSFSRIRIVQHPLLRLSSLVCLALCCGLVGCGGSSSTNSGGNNSGGNNSATNTPKGTYTITVTATAGSTTHTSNFMLTVQ